MNCVVSEDGNERDFKNIIIKCAKKLGPKKRRESTLGKQRKLTMLAHKDGWLIEKKLDYNLKVIYFVDYLSAKNRADLVIIFFIKFPQSKYIAFM